MPKGNHVKAVFTSIVDVFSTNFKRMALISIANSYGVVFVYLIFNYVIMSNSIPHKKLRCRMEPFVVCKFVKERNNLATGPNKGRLVCNKDKYDT